MVLLVIAVPIVVAMIVMYVSWQSSPEKALADAVTYARATPGAYHVTSGNTNVTAHYDGKVLAASGVYSGVKFDSIIQGQMAYVKTTTPDKLIALLGQGDVPTTLQPLVDVISKLITNRWIGVSLNQLSRNSTTAEGASCIVDGNDELTRNTGAATQLVKAYMQHGFMKIKTTKNGSMQTFDMTFDNDKIKGFWDTFEKTQYYQSLTTDCASLLGTVRGVDVSALAATVTVDGSHILKTIQLTLPNKQQVRIEAVYGHEPAIAVPTDALSYDTLSNTIWQSVFRP